MNNTITGRVICAGKLKDNNGDEFHGVMVDTGKMQLTGKSIPLYIDASVIPATATADDVYEWLQIGISVQQYKKLAAMLAHDTAPENNL